jgi:abortive infection bacteriophage resistance protein
MKYTKLPYTFEEQADKLLHKGLVADRDELISRLRRVSYYRLNAYFYPFKDKVTRNFKYPITLEKVWANYTFDRQLRLIVFDGIERVEIAVRTSLLHIFAHKYGTFGYLDAKNLPFINSYFPDGFDRWVESLKTETKRSKEDFIKHFINKYGDEHDLPPIWALAEIMNFGDMQQFFNAVEIDIKKEIAKEFGVSVDVLVSWIRAIGAVRNICAHHGRLFNRGLGLQPNIPRRNKYPEWHNPFTFDNRKIASVITVLKVMLGVVAPTSSWSSRFIKLMNSNPNIPNRWMGFPDNWRDHELWKNT